MDLLSIRGLRYAYNQGQDVLHGIGLTVGEGEMVGLLGPNGSGKTTLLRCISGVLGGTKGDIRLVGRPVPQYTRRELARLIALVPQFQEVGYEFSCYDVVLMGRYAHLRGLRGESETDCRAARRAMEQTDTWEFRDRPVDSLSGGERQRVMIARAIAQDARLLLMDEPTAHLDIRHQTDVLDLIGSLHRSHGLTVIGVYHDINLAGRYAERLVLMREGVIAADGTARDVLTSDNLKQVYGIGVSVFDSPADGSLCVFPQSNEAAYKKERY
jgi:iron complex transport system ATP-binding protein